MARYIALLRGINVGGHVVKMTDLRAPFEALGLSNVTTFIASGNVIFESPVTDARSLETQIEQQLKQSLGYEVATMLRTPTEITAIAAYEPFPPLDPGTETWNSIIFLTHAPSEKDQQTITGFQTTNDELHAYQREIYWRCRTRTSDSLINWPAFARAVRIPTTTRNVTTVRKLAAKYGA